MPGEHFIISSAGWCAWRKDRQAPRESGWLGAEADVPAPRWEAGWDETPRGVLVMVGMPGSWRGEYLTVSRGKVTFWSGNKVLETKRCQPDGSALSSAPLGSDGISCVLVGALSLVTSERFRILTRVLMDHGTGQ